MWSGLMFKHYDNNNQLLKHYYLYYSTTMDYFNVAHLDVIYILSRNQSSHLLYLHRIRNVAVVESTDVCGAQVAIAEPWPSQSAEIEHPFIGASDGKRVIRQVVVQAFQEGCGKGADERLSKIIVGSPAAASH